MNFSVALNHLKNGDKIYRKGWNGKGMWIQLQKPDCQSKMNLPYIYMKTVEDDFVPFTFTHTDILSDDWETIDKTMFQKLSLSTIKEIFPLEYNGDVLELVTSLLKGYYDTIHYEYGYIVLSGDSKKIKPLIDVLGQPIESSVTLSSHPYYYDKIKWDIFTFVTR